MHECPQCGDICDCDNEDTHFDDYDDECLHECEGLEGDDYDDE